MTVDEILEGNKLIAEFMGYEGQHEDWCGNNIEVEDQFSETGKSMIAYSPNESWRWLMEAVIKIEDGLFAVEIKDNHCFISGYRKYEGFTILHKKSMESKITATYKAVVAFIKWYNTNKS